jgi:hypothetical protein
VSQNVADTDQKRRKCIEWAGLSEFPAAQKNQYIFSMVFLISFQRLSTSSDRLKKLLDAMFASESIPKTRMQDVYRLNSKADNQFKHESNAQLFRFKESVNADQMVQKFHFSLCLYEQRR